MARRRDEKPLAELLSGIMIFFVGISVFNPKSREQIFSTLTTIIAFIIVLAILGFIIYLFIQSRKIAEEPADSRAFNRVPSPTVNPPPVYISTMRYEDTTSGREEIKEQSRPAQRIWDISVLQDIEWKRFETVCTEYLRLAGFVATETKIGADGGIDIRISKANDENFRGIVQCKAWNTYRVGVKSIRELFGIMAAERISIGLFMTSGVFTSEAEEFAKGKITLVWGEKFISLIKKLSDEDQQRLLDIALEGDYKTPTCPQCGIKMVLRESKKGRNIGGHFWGCVNYPRCKQTLICRSKQ